MNVNRISAYCREYYAPITELREDAMSGEASVGKEVAASEKGFASKVTGNKKALLIAGGAAAVVGVGYAIYHKMHKDSAEENAKLSQR
ncbi:MAG: hypothetical protein ABL867_06365 [Rickettsiales bacterium]